MVTIAEGAGFRKNVALLKTQQVVKNMAAGMQGVPREKWLSNDGLPLWDFIQAANDEYKSRLPQPSADLSRFVGSVAHAVAELVKEGK